MSSCPYLTSQAFCNIFCPAEEGSGRMALEGTWHQARVKPPQQGMWGHDQSHPGVSLETTVGWGGLFFH